jgi:hypothetical protein|eukprot:COSAG06_NODE_12554_length_1364_cov_1.012648_2_plen_84_part_00
MSSGIDGGNPRGCSPDTGTTGCMPGGYGHGPDGRALMLRPGGQVTTWKRGSVVEAKWTIGANHNVSDTICSATELTPMWVVVW